MPTIIDALVVTLGLDATQFQQGQQNLTVALAVTRNEASRTAKEMESDGKRAASYFTQVKNEALGLIGVLLGGKSISAFAKEATNDIAGLGRSARFIGTTVPELAAFRNAIERNGGSADAAVQSMQNLTDEMEKFKLYGQSSIIRFLNPIGGQRGDTAMDIYMKFVKFAEEHKKDPALVKQIGEGLGLDYGSITEALKGVAQVKADLAKSYELGVPTEKQAQQLTEFQQDVVGLKQAFEQLGIDILTDVEPALHKFITTAEDYMKKHPELKGKIEALGVALTVLAGVRISASLMGITGLMAELGPLVIALGAIEAFDLWYTGKKTDIPQLEQPTGPDSPIPGLPTIGPDDDHKPDPAAKPSGWLDKPDEWLRNYWTQKWGGTAGGATDLRKAQVRDELMKRLEIPIDAAAGLVSNLNAESGLQGIPNAEVPFTSTSAFGWAQWVGPRRKKFDKFVADHGLDPKSDEANMGFLVQELKQDYPELLAKLRSGKLTATQAANEIFLFESGGAPKLEKYRMGHVGSAEDIAKLPPGTAPNSVPRTGPLFGPQRKPTDPPPPPGSYNDKPSIELPQPLWGPQKNWR